MIKLNDLQAIRQKHTDQTIVLTSGTFDLLHVGHLHYLQKVKSYGDIVVVLLSSDERVRARKGAARPIIPENDRAEMLEALQVVDYVILDPVSPSRGPSDPLYAKLITGLQPNAYVTDGPDPRFVDILETSQCTVLPIVTSGTPASTSDIINSIITAVEK